MNFFTKTEERIDRFGDKYTKKTVIKHRVVLTAILALFLLITLLSSTVIIPSGFTGVSTQFGQVDPHVMDSGFHFKVPFVQGVRKVNNKQQEIEFKDQVWGESSERTVVYMAGVTVTYRINPEYSAWIYANVDNYKQNALPRTLVASAMKASMVALPSNDVTNRAKIEPLAVQNLQAAIDEKYNGEPVITIINVNIDDMDFEDSYNQAIAQKQISQMNYEQQQIENERSVAAAQAEAEKKVIEANAEADKKRITAEADAEQARIAAQAEADAIKSVADAQAEANRKLAESVTDALIEYEKVKSWDGKLPKVTDGNSLISFGIE